MTEEKAVNMHFRHVLRSITLALVAFGFAAPVMAQGLSRVELSGGWQLLHGEGNTESLNGWYGDVGLNLNRVVALVGGTDRFYETLDVSEPLGNLIINLRAQTRMQTFSEAAASACERCRVSCRSSRSSEGQPMFRTQLRRPSQGWLRKPRNRRRLTMCFRSPAA